MQNKHVVGGGITTTLGKHTLVKPYPFAYLCYS